MSDIETLLKIDVSARDEAWEKSLMAELPKAQVRLLAAEPKGGPDGWPYMMVATGEGADEPVTNLLSWLSSRGIGLAVNPQKPTPDFVLTYGMLWNFRERGEFVTETNLPPRSSSIAIQDGQEVLAGPPSESYLPKYVRGILKQFLADQGIFAPKVLMVSFDKQNYDLCFSIESLKSPPAHEHGQIAEALSWFLPAHYAVSLVSEKTIPGFQPL